MADTLQSEAGAASLIADHLALDMLNTEAGVGDAQQDFWWSSHAVLDWLEHCGIDAGAVAGPVADTLLRDARALRAAARNIAPKPLPTRSRRWDACSGVSQLLPGAAA